LQAAAGHDVVERAHALEQRDVLERARDAAARRRVGAHLLARLAAEGDAALLRMIEAVDDVEERRLSGAVRPDDGADFALANVEGDVGDRLHAAEGERHVLEREQHLPGQHLARWRSHAAFSMAVATGATFTSRIFSRAEIVPLRPSSKVT